YPPQAWRNSCLTRAARRADSASSMVVGWPAARAKEGDSSKASSNARGVVMAVASGWTLAEHVQHVVARAHGVVVSLAGGTFLVAVLAVAAIEDAVPGAVLVVDEMPPRVFPQALVPVPGPQPRR